MTWYAIASLTLENHPVLFRFGEGDVEGQLRVRGSKNIYRVKRGPRQFEDLPGYATPWFWRPLGPWPLPLPEPVTEFSKPNIKTPTATGNTFFEDGDQLNTTVRLGRALEPPESVAECEARIWRAIRTANVMAFEDGRVGPKGHARNMWPPKLMTDIRALHRWMESSRFNNPMNFRRQDWDDYDIDRNNVQALPARWEPTPRDISDYDAAILERWGQDLDRLDWRIVYARAHLAQMSWPAIAQREKKHYTTITRRYHKALQVMFVRAQIAEQEAA